MSINHFATEKVSYQKKMLIGNENWNVLSFLFFSFGVSHLSPFCLQVYLYHLKSKHKLDDINIQKLLS